jgi:phosphonate transport system permease protein
MQRLTLTRAAYQTLLIGFLGTVLGFLPALAFGVLGSERVVPFPFNFIFRGTMSAIRAIPALIWIFLFIPFNTLSPFTAVLAIATDSIGNLGRLFVDELEEIEEGPIEAIRSTGASGSQTVSFGMLSQVARSYIAWTLYVLEINTRIAVSLGVVGAGGLGVIIENNMPFEQYSRAAAGILMIFLTVITIEMISTRIRTRLRPGEHDSPSLLDLVRGFFDPYKWAGLPSDRRRGD